MLPPDDPRQLPRNRPNRRRRPTCPASRRRYEATARLLFRKSRTLIRSKPLRPGEISDRMTPKGVRAVVREVFPDADLQLYRVHRMKNVIDTSAGICANFGDCARWHLNLRPLSLRIVNAIEELTGSGDHDHKTMPKAGTAHRTELRIPAEDRPLPADGAERSKSRAADAATWCFCQLKSMTGCGH